MGKECSKDAIRTSIRSEMFCQLTTLEFSIGFENQGIMIIGYRSYPCRLFRSGNSGRHR